MLNVVVSFCFEAYAFAHIKSNMFLNMDLLGPQFKIPVCNV